MPSSPIGPGRPPRPGLDALDRALIDAAGSRLAAGLHWGCPDLACAAGTTKQTATTRVRRLQALGLWPHAQSPPSPIAPPPAWLPLAPLDDRRRRLAEDHFAPALAAAGRLSRLGDDATSEAAWTVVRLAARWVGDEPGFAAELDRKLKGVRFRAWETRRVVAKVKGWPAPCVDSLTLPSGELMEIVDDKVGQTYEFEEVQSPMIFAVNYVLPGGAVRYVGSTGELVDDPAEARKHCTIADAECWRLANIPAHALSRSAVVKVCDGNQFDRASVVLDRTKAIDAGTVATNGAVGKHVEESKS